MKNFKNKKTTVEVYNKLLKYPPFASKRLVGTMKIVHNLAGGKSITTIAPEYVTTEDAEKLYILCFFAQKNKSYHIIETENFGKIVELSAEINDIRKMSNNNNDEHIINSLKRIKQITIHFEFKNKKRSTGVIHDIIYDPKTGKINVLMSVKMFNNFANKALTLDIANYAKMTPGTKNLYSFIISNSGDKFKEDLMIERAVIQAGRKDTAQRILKENLNELKENHIIIDFEITKKDRKRYINIRKNRGNELSTAGGKHYPQQVEKQI